MFTYLTYLYIFGRMQWGCFSHGGDGIRKNDTSERASEHPEVFLGQIYMDTADGRWSLLNSIIFNWIIYIYIYIYIYGYILYCYMMLYAYSFIIYIWLSVIYYIYAIQLYTCIYYIYIHVYRYTIYRYQLYKLYKSQVDFFGNSTSWLSVGPR